jgi:alpha-galactosidase
VHPDWFIKNDSGEPLLADRVTFGGWRRGPWDALDGTHPEIQDHLEGLFRTMRWDWGCTYFKLDANFWGTMHGGHLHDPQATRVEAYHWGMEAILWRPVTASSSIAIIRSGHPSA